MFWITDFGKDFKQLDLVITDDLGDDLAPRSDDYALMYRKQVHRIPAGSRVETDIAGSIRIVTDVNETQH